MGRVFAGRGGKRVAAPSLWERRVGRAMLGAGWSSGSSTTSSISMISSGGVNGSLSLVMSRRMA